MPTSENLSQSTGFSAKGGSASASDHSNVTTTEEGEEGTPESATVELRKPVTFGGLTPREARLRRAAMERERKAQAESEADYAHLTVAGRTSLALAKQLQLPDLEAVIDGLKKRAVQNRQDAAELRAWLALAEVKGPDEPGAEQDWEKLPGDVRASLRAQMLAVAAQMEAEGASGAESEPPADDPFDAEASVPPTERPPTPPQDEPLRA